MSSGTDLRAGVLPANHWRGAPQPARRWVTGRRVAFAVVLALLIFSARSCQQSQVRFPQERAVALAREHVSFAPTSSQVRLVREGLSSRPYWAVSLSVPAARGQRGYAHLAVVRVDANSGKLIAVAVQPESGG